MIIVDAEQGSAAWISARLGRVTASRFKDVLAKGDGISRKNYMLQLVSERLTGKKSESWKGNSHSERGHVQEPFARFEYEARTRNIVQEVGFIQHPTLMAGCSPDGLIDEDGGLEAKSVIPTVQIATIQSGGYPSTHKAQIQGSLWNTKRTWWDFTSFSPDLPKNLRLYIFRVFRDEAYIATLEAEIIVFLRELDALELKLRNTH